MSSTKTITWEGEPKSTRYGLMVEGRVITLPKKDADSYIEQKLAHEESDSEELINEEDS